MPTDEILKNSIIELYQCVKIRNQSDTKKIDKDFLDQEKTSLQTVSSLSLINYIKVNLNILIKLKVIDKLSKLKSNPFENISLYDSELPTNDYEKLLRRYEADIRNYIKVVNFLKIHIEELNQKQEILEKQIEQMQKESMNFIPPTQSIEYRKKIEELTTMIKTYEKRELKIPLLEKKIKKQKIELDKLDLYYKKQIQNYAKKIENYEKGIYLNNNCHMNKRAKIYKPKHRLNSISPKRKTNSIIKHNKYSQLKTIEDETTFNNMKRTRSINNIFFQIKNNEIQKKINSNINSNLNINGGNLNIQQNNRLKSENIINSPKYIDNNVVSNYYDSIETDSIDNKTINIAGTASNFRKKLNLKSNYRYVSSKEKDKDKKIEKENIRKAQTKVSAKKVMKRINSNRTSLKIPKNIPNNINTSKYIHTKEKKIPKFTRYNSLKQLSNGKSRKNNTSTKENECFNKTFSRVEYANNNNITTARYNSNTNQSQRNSAKNFILNKITKVTIINGKTPVPIQRTQSKTRSIIK